MSEMFKNSMHEGVIINLLLYWKYGGKRRTEFDCLRIIASGGLF
jgi:hypothetical protein